MAGKIIETCEKVSSNGTIQIGSNLQAGFYILRLSRGKGIKVFKLVKQ
jgi:hypothetical protein